MENKEIKQCPYCGEDILAVAKKCKHCGEWLTEEEPTPVKIIPCPICGEDVEEGVDVCPHCGEPMSPSTSVSAHPIQQSAVANSYQPNQQQVAETPQPDQQQDISDNTLFKDFLTSMGLSRGLLVLSAATLGISIIAVIVAENYSSAIGALLSGVFSLLIIQRVVLDRSKVDMMSWMAIGAAVASCIASFVSTSSLGNPSLDALEYARMDDSTTFTIELRYYFACGMIWYILGSALDCGWKYMLSKNGKAGFKATMLVGMSGNVLMLLYALLIKSLSEALLVLGLLLIGIISIAYAMMLLVNGIGEYSVKSSTN